MQRNAEILMQSGLKDGDETIKKWKPRKIHDYVNTYVCLWQ